MTMIQQSEEICKRLRAKGYVSEPLEIEKALQLAAAASKGAAAKDSHARLGAALGKFRTNTVIDAETRELIKQVLSEIGYQAPAVVRR